jgi:hypothetical protein
LLDRQVLLFHSDVVDLVLTLQFVDLHLTVEFEGTVLATHASVKQFIEVDVTVVAPDTHLEHHFFHLVISSVLGKSQWHRQLLKEVIKPLFPEFETPVPSLSEVNPSDHKYIE